MTGPKAIAEKLTGDNGKAGDWGLYRAALPFALGVCLLQQVFELPSPGLFFPMVLAALIPALGVPRLRWLFPLLMGVVWAWAHAAWMLHNALPTELEGHDLDVTGRVAGLPQPRGKGLRFLFDVETVDGGSFSGRVRLNWYRDAPVMHSGERWRLRIRLKAPHGFANPGGFDYEGWLFRQGIRATGYVRRDGNNGSVSDSGYSVDRLRQGLGEALGTLDLDGVAAGLIPALVLGDRGGLQRDDWEVLTRTGTNHLIAISGLHVGIMAGLAFFLLRWLWCRSTWLAERLAADRAAAVAGLLSAVGYAALAGFAVSTQRALIMLALVFGALLLRRTLRPMAALSIALALVLLLDPFACLSPGFWLSFGAVAVLLFGMTRRVGAGGLAWRWGRAQWLVALGLLPLLFLLFGRAAPPAPLVNLIAVPLFSLLLPMVLGGVAMALLFGWSAPLHAVAWLLNRSYELLALVAEHPWSTWVLPEQPVWVWAAAFLGVFLLLLPRGLPGRWTGLVFVLPLFSLPPQPPAEGAYRFTLLDVGQGLAAVVQTHTHVLVFDTGPGFSGGFNTGSAVIVPFLRARGIERVDTLIVSHADQDHAGGTKGLVAGMHVDKVLSGEPGELELVSADLCLLGGYWRWDGVEFRLLQPQLPLPEESNNRSCVLKVENGSAGVLLTGDAEAEVEDRLVAGQGERLSSHVLVAGHHGSATSSSQDFLDAVRPDYVLFAAGYRNRYGFPRPWITKRARDSGALTLNSADTGAIEWSFPTIGAPTGPILHRRARRHYWSHRTPVLEALQSGYH